MRDRIIIALAVLFIGACALFTFNRINSSYSPAYYPDPSPPPLVPAATASPTASSSAETTNLYFSASTATTPASSVSTAPVTPRPTHTITAWVTVPAPPG